MVLTIYEAAHYRDGPKDGIKATPPPTPSHTMGTKLSPAAVPKRMIPSLSSAAYTPPPSVLQTCGKVDTQFQRFCYSRLCTALTVFG